MNHFRRVLDWVLTLNLILVTVLAVYFWWTGQLRIEVQPATTTTQQSVDAVTTNLFNTTIRSEVDRQLGAPENGYTPDMFITVFPGLTTTDFEDVEAGVGKYVVVEGQLVHVMPPNVPRHSAVAAITSRGFTTLLQNVAARGQINLATNGTITDIMEMLSKN
jgi:hypothetical protein